MLYTLSDINEMCKKALESIETFYQQDFLNYKGRTTDTDQLYTEVVANFVLKNIDVFLYNIPRITRSKDYDQKHDGSYRESTGIMELGAEKINQIWRDAKLRAVGMKRATTLCETAKRSIGLRKGSSAGKYEMKMLLADYEYKMAQLDSVMEEIESLCKKISESEQMLAIKGIGVITVAGFLAEVGDIRRFESPRQIQKLAGLSLRENSSGNP